MNWDRVQGNWKQLKGKVQEQWGKLTDDDFDQIEGRREQLVGRLQERSLDRLAENVRRIRVDAGFRDLVTLHQVHSARVHVVASPTSSTSGSR